MVWLVGLVVGLALACAVVHERLARQGVGKCQQRQAAEAHQSWEHNIYISKQAIAGKVNTACERETCARC